MLEAIHYQIYRRATSPRFLLLEVQADPARAGQVELLDRNRMRGYISRLAPYTHSEEGDDAGWTSILAQALAHNADAPVATPWRQPAVGPRSRWCCRSRPDLNRTCSAAVPGDLRGGMPARIGGNDWCRQIDEDTYRLHANGLERSRNRAALDGRAPSAEQRFDRWRLVRDQRIAAGSCNAGGDRRQWGQFCAASTSSTALVEQHLSLLMPPDLANPLTVSLYAEPLMPLEGGGACRYRHRSDQGGPAQRLEVVSIMPFARASHLAKRTMIGAIANGQQAGSVDVILAVRSLGGGLGVLARSLAPTAHAGRGSARTAI